MKVLQLLVLLFLGCFANAYAGTLFRLPLYSHPGWYSAWFDHDPNPGVIRYDCLSQIPYNGHPGTDLPVPVNTPVLAGAVGNMYSWVNNCPNGPSSGPNNNNRTCGGGFGNHVRIRHPMDQLVSISAHLTAVFTPLFNPWCGAQIGISGNSGKSDGPHLHYELRTSDQGTSIDFFGGSCSWPGYWVNQNGGFPTSQCQ